MVDTTLLNSDSATGVSLATGATKDMDFLCQNRSILAVQADMNGAANADLGIAVFPFEEDLTTVSGVALAAEKSTGPTFAGGKVTYVGRYDVTALRKVRVRVTNNNAGTQTLNRLSWRLD